jgi:hypothetical protein
MLGLLVAFDDCNWKSVFQDFNGFYQQRGFSGPGTGNQIQRKNMMLPKISPVLLRISIIFTEQVLLDFNQALCVVMVMIVTMLMTSPAYRLEFVNFAGLAATAYSAHK